MGRKFDFRYLILGGGVAGSTLAMVLAKNKASVAVIDNKMKDSAAQKLANTGVTVVLGTGKIKDRHTIRVLNKDFSAETLIIATGRKMDARKIDGLVDTNFLTLDTLMRLQHLPQTALVVGGGTDGCRAAEYLAERGVKTILMEKTSTLMPNEDPDAGATLHSYLKNILGVLVLTSTEVEQVDFDDQGNAKVIFLSNNKEFKLRVNTVVLATEKKPLVIDLGLENAGVLYNENGIQVDHLLKTNVDNIYAVGGVLGGEISRERANYAGIILGKNLITHGKNLFNYSGFARVSKTFPEIATIGVSEKTLNLKHAKYKVATVLLKDTEAGEYANFNQGFVKIIVDRQGKILGATIVAPEAELMIQELSLAIRQQLTINQIAGTPHPLGQFSIAIKTAAKKLAIKKI